MMLELGFLHLTMKKKKLLKFLKEFPKQVLLSYFPYTELFTSKKYNIANKCIGLVFFSAASKPCLFSLLVQTKFCFKFPKLYIFRLIQKGKDRYKYIQIGKKRQKQILICGLVFTNTNPNRNICHSLLCTVYCALCTVQ